MCLLYCLEKEGEGAPIDFCNYEPHTMQDQHMQFFMCIIMRWNVCHINSTLEYMGPTIEKTGV